MSLRHLVICGIVASLLVGCVCSLIVGHLAETPLRFEDVSQTDEYYPFIGRRYILATNMLVYGVCLPPGYKETIQAYFMTPDTPGPWGREVLSKDRVKAGSTMEILRVQRSVQHILGVSPTVEAVVRLSDFTKDTDIPVTVNWHYIICSNYWGIKETEKIKGTDH